MSEPRVNILVGASVWVVLIHHEGLIHQCAYSSREAAEASVREDHEGEIPDYYAIQELKVVA